jgi:adenine-specific DNA-methyltransferase
MPILDWLNKDAAIKARNSVPYRLLKPVKKLSYGDHESENILIQGVGH